MFHDSLGYKENQIPQQAERQFSRAKNESISQVTLVTIAATYDFLNSKVGVLSPPVRSYYQSVFRAEERDSIDS